MSTVRFIVDRLWVWEPDRKVIKAIWMQCNKDGKSRRYRKMRHVLYREALRIHHANQDLCRQFRL